MTSMKPVSARVSMIVAAPSAAVVDAFVEPKRLTQFWLSNAGARLEIGRTVKWDFMVPGASVETTATRIDESGVAWKWSDGSTVTIELEDVDEGTAITLVNADFAGDREAQVEAALNATEGFAIVLCDLKTLLESGKSAGLTKSKAKLIESSLHD